MIPFVAAIVTAVDLEAGRLTIDPPSGLLPDEGAGTDAVDAASSVDSASSVDTASSVDAASTRPE
jgi:16S rRNA processing protein RimM